MKGSASPWRMSVGAAGSDLGNGGVVLEQRPNLLRVRNLAAGLLLGVGVIEHKGRIDRAVFGLLKGHHIRALAVKVQPVARWKKTPYGLDLARYPLHGVRIIGIARLTGRTYQEPERAARRGPGDAEAAGHLHGNRRHDNERTVRPVERPGPCPASQNAGHCCGPRQRRYSLGAAESESTGENWDRQSFRRWIGHCH